MHVFYIYAKEKYSNQICKYKSLHEINFIHNERLDSVFIQQHMHTYILPFLLAHSECFRLLFDPLFTRVRVKASRKRQGDCESMMQSIQTHDNDRTTVPPTCEAQHDRACLLTDSESNLCTQTEHCCLMPWLSMGDTW